MRAMSVDDMILCGGNGEAERFCYCDELLDADHKRLPCPKWHDCSYVAARNRLLPQAIEIANEIARSKPTKDDDANSRSVRFSRALSITMDRLAAPLLRNGA